MLESSPKDLHLDYPSWRSGQIRAVEWLEADGWLDPAYMRDMQNMWDERKIKALEAPTGSGKTGIILALAALNPDLRFLILCATKLEQEQYLKNLLPDSQVFSVKGKNNFHCKFDDPETEGVNEECEASGCTLVHVDQAPCEAGMECEFKEDNSCYYYRQQGEALLYPVVITNYSYGLSMANYAHEALGKFDVIVEDEGHVLDSELEKFITVSLSRRIVKRVFPLELPSFPDGGDLPGWQSWIEDNRIGLASARKRFDGIRAENLNKDELRESLTVTRYLEHFDMILSLPYEWVVEDNEATVEFKPVWVTADSEKVLFKYAPRHIIMSGTIPSVLELAKKVGIKPGAFEFLRLPYTFPPENRPIILKPIASLARKDLRANLPLILRAVDEDIGANLDIKILIHTKTYEIAEYLKERSEYSHFFFTHATATRNAVLQEFKASEAPAILVSPSFDKAIDLPGDECELILILKLPYPYLGTKVMQRRVKQSRRYYLHETLMGVIQMAGRGPRSEVDKCPTKIYDAAAPKFFRQVRKMVPKGIKEVIMEEIDGKEQRFF